MFSRGWHADLAVPAGELAGGLAVFRRVFPGARTVVFGYGKRTFMTARADRLSEYLLGPLPGPAVIEAFGLSATAEQAFGPSDRVTLALPAGGADALSAFVWGDLDRDGQGRPRLVGPGAFAGSLFYAARSGYGLGHTCNTWVAQALHAARLPVRAEGVVFSGQAMGRAEAAARRCPGPPSAPEAAQGEGR